MFSETVFSETALVSETVVLESVITCKVSCFVALPLSVAIVSCFLCWPYILGLECGIGRCIPLTTFILRFRPVLANAKCILISAISAQQLDGLSHHSLVCCKQGPVKKTEVSNPTVAEGSLEAAHSETGSPKEIPSQNRKSSRKDLKDGAGTVSGGVSDTVSGDLSG